MREKRDNQQRIKNTSVGASFNNGIQHHSLLSQKQIGTKKQQGNGGQLEYSSKIYKWQQM